VDWQAEHFVALFMSVSDLIVFKAQQCGLSGSRVQHTHHHAHNYDFASIQEENVGSINFSLSYDPDQSLLTVRLIQVHWHSRELKYG
jgi:hypothetical protein